MKLFDLLQLRYTEFQDRVRLELSKVLSDYGENYGNNTIFGQLLNVLGSAVQNTLLYIEDGMTEQNKYTAQRKKSIYSLAQLTGYNPSLGKATTCNVRLVFVPSNYNSTTVVIKNKTPLICSFNGLKYNVVLPQEAITLSLNNDNANKFLQVVEGNYETQHFSAEGGQLYTQTVLFNGDIDIDFLEVKVNDEIWTRKDSLYDMEPNAKQYTVKTGLNKGIDIIFGNDEFGKALNTNDKISVTYLTHDGELGNINTQDEVYFSFDEEIYDAHGNNINANEILVIKLADTNSVSSGTFSETTDKVREMIGFNSRALVLADPKNYNVFLNKFSFVGYNNTWADEGSLIVKSIILKNYKQNINEGKDYFTLSKNDLLLNENQKNSIKLCIANSGQQLAGTTYEIYDPDIYRYACYIYLKMKDVQYDANAIENKIRDLIGNYMMNIDNASYIPKSSIVHLIKDNISEIDSVDLYFLSEKNEQAIIDGKYINKIYNFNPAKGTYDIRTETVYLDPGDNPGLGFDEYGNIWIDNQQSFPVLMGGWKFRSSKFSEEPQYTTVVDPLSIIFR